MENLKKLRIFFNLTQDDLAKKLNLEKQTVVQYESGRNTPLFKYLIKMPDIFKISLDFLILNDACCYPRNLTLLKLSNKLDNFYQSQERSHIEITAKSLLDKMNNEDLILKQDLIEIELSNDFHSNLKKIRSFKNITQVDLANSIGISRGLLAMYESKVYPPIDKLIKFSEALNISIHALTTGEKLFFDFQDKHFAKTMFLSDKILSLEDQQFLIKLIQKILDKSQS